MQSGLPVQIETHSFGQGVRYCLPRRELGGGKFVALFCIVFGLIFGAVSIPMIVRPIAEMLRDGFYIRTVVELLFGIPFLAGGLIPIAVGFFILMGRTEVELAEGKIRSTEIAGPFRWRRSRIARDIQRLEVMHGAAEVNGKPVTSGPWSKMAGIKVQFATGKPMMLVAGYTVDLLQPLADELARRVGDVNVLAGGNVPKVAVVEAFGPGTREHDVEETLPQPASSRIKLETAPAGTIITIPPAGLSRGSKGLLFFSVIWNSFVLFFIGMWAFGVKKFQGSILAGIAFISVFLAIGVGMLLGTINMARRRAMFLATDQGLKCVQVSVFGTKKFEWSREQVAAIRVAPSGMTVNNVPVLELQVHSKNGKHQGLFAGRDEDELRWLASVLRNRLGVPASAPA